MYLLRTLDFLLSLAVCGCALWRLSNRTFPTWQRVYEGASDVLFVLHYCERISKAHHKSTAVWTPRNVLDLFYLSFSVVSIDASLWMSFNFLRILQLWFNWRAGLLVVPGFHTTSATVIFGAANDIIVLVFSFASVIMVFENLGEFDVFASHEAANFSFFNTVYFLFITVTTVG